MTCREERLCENDQPKPGRHADRVEEGAQVKWSGGRERRMDLCEGLVARRVTPSQILVEMKMSSQQAGISHVSSAI